MSERLSRKGYPEDETGRAIERLEKLGFVDDRALACSLGRKARETKLLGRRGASSYLARMGIPGPDAEEALADYEESEAAKRVVEKRLRGMKGLSPEVQRRRVYAALQRKGFSADTVKKIARKIFNNKTLQMFEKEDEQ